MSRNILKHIKCRNAIYPGSTIERFPTSDNYVEWEVADNNYKPNFCESPVLLNKPWADNDIKKLTPKWNSLDGNVNRISFCGNYIIKNCYPLNPFGRTGIIGRGLLGRYGPNHAADPIVTRWKRDSNQEIISDQKSGKKILEMCSIQRHDCGQWAIPGGMVDPGEQVSITLKREFMEEALSNSESTSFLNDFFQTGVEIYKGYVDDPRNTDNSWMETVAVNFHDDKGDKVGKFKLSAGDDAAKVKWLELNQNVQLYASHSMIVKDVVDRLKAHW